MNMLELRLICDNINRIGGYREKEVLKGLIKVEVIMDDENYKVYRFEDKNGYSFEYDFKSHRITG